jgi:hypothetical protein
MRDDMHSRTTNISTQTSDIRRFSFESVVVLALDSEYRPTGYYIAFAKTQARTSLDTNPSILGATNVMPPGTCRLSAHAGIDWADTKRDVCCRAGDVDRLREAPGRLSLNLRPKHAIDSVDLV